MTIRYTCTGCESVLKIKDEKAGTKGKCPKCKAEFVVPQPDGVENPALEASAAPAAEESVDLPIDITPEVAGSGTFDPADFLSSAPAPKVGGGPRGSSTGLGDRKPSVAELMKDFEATKKKDRREKSSPELPQSAAGSAATAVQTAGSAAEMLNRAYQQKREAASAPSIRPQDVKAAEERALLMDFIRTRALPVIAALAVLGYGYYYWMTREAYNGPPLYPVSGTVMKGGAAVPGAIVEFHPVLEGPTDIRSVAGGRTDEQGTFVLLYQSGFEGAPIGDYDVMITGPDGNPATLVDGEQRVTVRDSGKNEFKYGL